MNRVLHWSQSRLLRTIHASQISCLVPTVADPVGESSSNRMTRDVGRLFTWYCSKLSFIVKFFSLRNHDGAEAVAEAVQVFWKKLRMLVQPLHDRVIRLRWIPLSVEEHFMSNFSRAPLWSTLRTPWPRRRMARLLPQGDLRRMLPSSVFDFVDVPQRLWLHS